jgi:hypothetical protein
VVHDEARCTLAMPPGCTWPCDDGNEEHMQTLYVRPCYRALAERVRLACCGRAVLLGSPGVGKTCFGRYLLWRLLRERAAAGADSGAVVYHSRDGRCAVLHAARPALLFRPGSTHVAHLLMRANTFYLVDARVPEAARCPTLLILSPVDRAVWAKWETQHNATRLLAPVFSPCELLACRAACLAAAP